MKTRSTLAVLHVVLVGAGIGYEFTFARRWVLMPTFAPGYYRRGNGKDLGYHRQIQ